MKVRRRFAKSEHAVISKIKNEIMNGQVDAIRKKYKLYIDYAVNLRATTCGSCYRVPRYTCVFVE